MRLVIELKDNRNRDLFIFSDTDIDITVIDWQSVREDADNLYAWQKNNPVAEAERELLHKTTGLKQVYP